MTCAGESTPYSIRCEWQRSETRSDLLQQPSGQRERKRTAGVQKDPQRRTLQVREHYKWLAVGEFALVLRQIQRGQFRVSKQLRQMPGRNRIGPLGQDLDHDGRCRVLQIFRDPDIAVRSNPLLQSVSAGVVFRFQRRLCYQPPRSSPRRHFSSTMRTSNGSFPTFFSLCFDGVPQLTSPALCVAVTILPSAPVT